MNDRGARLIGLDYLRGFVVVLVVLHHAVLAYPQFGHFNMQRYTWSTAPIVDPQRWAGFDVIVLFNDSYFMPLMFLLSGLFVKPSLIRKGAAAYLLDRTWRLAVPFVLVVLTLMPLAYYPSYRMTGSEIGFGAFWVQTVLHGPWPSGPPWFIAVLFGFDVVAAAGFSGVRRLDLGRWGLSFGVLAVVSLAALVPMLIWRGPLLWFTWGPFAIQESRVLLYAAYFFVGVAAGPGVRVQGRWPVVLGVLLFLPLLAMEIVRLRAPAVVSPLGWEVLYGVTMSLFCAGMTRGLLAAFGRFERRSTVWDSLSAHSYGIYLVHYLFVVWLQYALVGWRIGAIPKAAGVFVGALGLSWVCVAASGWLWRPVRSVVGFGQG